MMNTDAWFNEKRNIDKSKKHYTHFDNKTDIVKSRKLIEDPQWVSRHGFLPFIQFEKDSDRFSKKQGIIPKKRLISYASHLDSCIYQYYGYLLNEKYNAFVEKKQISESVAAYRTNFNNRNNITFAHDAFSFIKKCEDCYVLIGDFSDFFSSLNHLYLKQRLTDVLGYDYLPDDWYAVFKNITNYSWIDLTDIKRFYGVQTKKMMNELKLWKYDSPKEFQRKGFKIKSNKKVGKGIPQGSSMSGVLANVYMSEIDEIILKIVRRNDGFYCRYSDDFIVIIPAENVNEDFGLFREIVSVFDKAIYNLELKEEKKQFFHVANQSVMDLTNEFTSIKIPEKRVITFLGFSFNGQSVAFKSQTENRFYRKLRRKVKSLKRQQRKLLKRSPKEIYRLYSIRGDVFPNRNFLTYARQAETVFEGDSQLQRVRKRNMQKVRRFIKRA